MEEMMVTNPYNAHTYVTEDDETDPGYGFYLTEDDRVYYLDREGFEYRPNHLLDPESADVYGIKYVCCDQGIHYYQVQDEMNNEYLSGGGAIISYPTYSCKDSVTSMLDDTTSTSTRDTVHCPMGRVDSVASMPVVEDTQMATNSPVRAISRANSAPSFVVLDMDSEDEEEEREAILKWSELYPSTTTQQPRKNKEVVPTRTKVIADILPARRSSGHHEKSKRGGRRSRSRSGTRAKGEGKSEDRRERVSKRHIMKERAQSSRELQTGQKGQRSRSNGSRRELKEHLQQEGQTSRSSRSNNSRTKLHKAGSIDGEETSKKSRRPRSRSNGTLGKDEDAKKKNRRSRSRSSRDALAGGSEEESSKQKRRSRSRSSGHKLAAGQDKDSSKKHGRSRHRSPGGTLDAGPEDGSQSSGSKERSVTPPRNTNMRRRRSSGMINLASAASSLSNKDERTTSRDDMAITRAQSKRGLVPKTRARRVSQRNLMRQRCAAAVENVQTRRDQKEEELKAERIKQLEDTVASLQKQMVEDQAEKKIHAKRASVFGLGTAEKASNGLATIATVGLGTAEIASSGIATIATAAVGATVLMGKTAVNTAYGAGKLASSAGLAATHAAAGAVDLVVTSTTAQPASA